MFRLYASTSTFSYLLNKLHSYLFMSLSHFVFIHALIKTLSSIFTATHSHFTTLHPLYRWTIKARVTKKSDIKSWSKPNSQGTLFSIDLLDTDGTEIRATFFKEACDKFFPIIAEQKVSECY